MWCGQTFQITLTTSIHITHAVIGKGIDDSFVWVIRISARQSVVAHDTAFHHDLGVAVAGAFQHGRTVNGDTRQGITTAAIDVAVDLSSSHLNGGVATGAACGVVHLVVVTTGAEDVAVVGSGTLGAHQTIDIVDCVAAQDVAVLGTAESTTPNAIGSVACIHRHWHVHRDASVVDIGELPVFVNKFVTLTLAATEHVAIVAVQGDGDVVIITADGSHLGCWTHLSAHDGHFGIASAFNRLQVEDGVVELRVFVGIDDGIRRAQAHGSHLTAAIHAELHVAATDGDVGIARNKSRFTHGGQALAAAEYATAAVVVDGVVSNSHTVGRLGGIAHRAHHTIVHVDHGIVLDLANLAAAIHIAFHVGLH